MFSSSDLRFFVIIYYQENHLKKKSLYTSLKGIWKCYILDNSGKF